MGSLWQAVSSPKPSSPTLPNCAWCAASAEPPTNALFTCLLANLLDAVGGTLKPKVFCVQELADQGVGHPAFGLHANRPRVGREAAGWVEPERGLVRSTIAFT